MANKPNTGRKSKELTTVAPVAIIEDTVTLTGEIMEPLATAPRDDNLPHLPTRAEIKQVVSAAFRFKDAADRLNGRAVQSMAYAIMATWVDWRVNGNLDPEFDQVKIGDLGGTIHKANSGVKTELKEMLVKALLPKKIDTTCYPADQRASIEREYSNKMTLLGRGMNMAAILVQANVTHEMFDLKEHCFAVKPSLLIPRNHYTLPGGRLQNDDSPILLDRRPLSLSTPSRRDPTQHTFVKIVASVDQLNSATRDRMQIKSARSKKTATPLSDLSSAYIAAEITLETAIEILHSKFVKESKTDTTRGKLKPDDLHLDHWRMLSSIAMQSDEYQESEAFVLYRRTGMSSKTTTESDMDAA